MVSVALPMNGSYIFNSVISNSIPVMGASPIQAAILTGIINKTATIDTIKNFFIFLPQNYFLTKLYKKNSSLSNTFRRFLLK